MEQKFSIFRCPVLCWTEKRHFDVLERWTIEGNRTELKGFPSKKAAQDFLDKYLTIK